MIGAVLAAMLVAQLIAPDREPAARTFVPAAVALADASPRAVPDYPAILAHPLFSPTRQLNGDASAAAAQLADYAAVGAAIAGSQRTALVRAPSGQTLTLHLGDSLAGWRLAAIGRDTLVFQAQGVERRLTVGGAPAPAAPPALIR